jgi:hypothetical protein
MIALLIAIVVIALAVLTIWFRRTRRRGHVIQTDAPRRGDRTRRAAR